MKIILIALVFTGRLAFGQLELNTVLMESTFRIHGPEKGKAGASISYGSAFLMGKPIPDSERAYYVLITAGHVFDNIEGEKAYVMMHQVKPDGSYNNSLWPITLRNKDTNLYVKHPTADVAAVYADMPEDLNLSLLPTTLLADDDMLKKFKIHPGDDISALGFPLFTSSPFGYPILRSGRLSSYPITPTKTVKTIFFDYNVYAGNSGGPAYFIDRNRVYDDKTHLGETIQFVIGVVIQQATSTLTGERLGVAIIAPSPYIIETIALLPATSPYK